MKTIPMLFLVCLVAGGYAKLAPFTAVRWVDDLPQIQVDDEWYHVDRLDGHELDDILGFSKRQFRDRWQKRFSEDLVELLSEMGHPPGKTVSMELRHVETGEKKSLKEAAMTAEARRKAWEYNNRDDSRMQQLQSALGSRTKAPRSIDRDDAEQDLDELRLLLETRYSYCALKGVDLHSEFSESRDRLTPTVDRKQFAVEVMRILALFGDGHSRLRESPNDLLPSGYLPFLVAPAGDRLVAFRADRGGLLDEDFPYLVALDGRSVADWLAAARTLVAAGSDQFVRRQSCRNLRFVQWVRSELGMPLADTIEVELGQERGRKSRTIEVDVSDQKPTYGPWPRSSSRLLDGDVGYLRIDSMEDLEDEPAVGEEIRDWMKNFRETRGLIIDVRGNGGGTRDILKLLFPYFMKKSDSPRIVNVAAKRLEPGEDGRRAEGYLDNRSLYPKNSSTFDAADRKAIERATKKFRPEWKLPKGKFSDWHWFVIRPTVDGGTYHYDNPVVILMDTGCFSATDIFLGAFKGWRSITLMGTPSGGGSGRSRGYELPKSGLRLKLSSMASFQPNGQLYDGNGIMPDVVVEPSPNDYTTGSDTLLEAALDRL